MDSVKVENTAVNAKATTTQPQGAIQMSEQNTTPGLIFFPLTSSTDVMNAAPTNSKQVHQEHQHKASRIRGGGAGKVSSIS